MSGKQKWLAGVAGALALTCLSWAPARAGVFVNIGVPLPIYGPHYHHYGYYGPRVYVAAPPVVIGSAPVYVAAPPATVYVPAQTAPAPLATPPPVPPAPVPVSPGN